MIDADALNIISDNMILLNEHKMPVIVTPHLGEMSRLMKRALLIYRRISSVWQENLHACTM